ncbi:hypothetical protein C0583_02415 [Candidatus Parcubacteria bacterium]|nr:MAG: hypothetical protein C0583_02415 [Candidatus Parcubacteria bacterium]
MFSVIYLCYNKIMNINKQKILKYFIYGLEILAVLILLYLLLFPFYPWLVYKFKYEDKVEFVPYESSNATTSLEAHKRVINSVLPSIDYDVSPNRLIIPKIGVNAPIVESDNEQQGLSMGAWRVPDSSTPDQGGNTVITGHRFKYLPPHNVTFYSFDKLEKGDLVTVLWNKEEINYHIIETKVVPETEISIMDQTVEPRLTMFTCTPIYSTENRLVVIAEPIEN